jgi:hypothetical protein
MMMNAEQLKIMTISNIASLAWADWKATSKSGVNYAAKPYLEAMLDCETMDSKYGCEDGRTQVAYFLSNATSYRGEQAKLIKAELNRRLKGK